MHRFSLHVLILLATFILLFRQQIALITHVASNNSRRVTYYLDVRKTILCFIRHFQHVGVHARELKVRWRSV
uniref:Putative secreted protein n=1 Tax=Rhipicephalus microplus TaxID=6941 RepID=A0A6M2DBH5_RHIMP